MMLHILNRNLLNRLVKNELYILIEFTKEILKAVCQYQSLLTILKSLKAPKLLAP